MDVITALELTVRCGSLRDRSTFRRYNDDWNALVMKGIASASGYVSWTYPATREELQEMLVKLG